MNIYNVMTDDEKFKFQFVISCDAKGSVLSINTKIFYIDAKLEFLEVLKFEDKGSLLKQKIEFDLQSCEEYALFGYVVLRRIRTEEGVFVGVDSHFHYGEKQNIIEFEGFLIYEQWSISPTPPAPLPNPDSPTPQPVDITIQSDLVNDLFPYVYMRRWPGISDEDFLFNFVIYENNDPSPTQKYLIETLMKERENRSIMNQESIGFIEGKGDFDPVYLKHIGNLLPPFDKIYFFYNELQPPVEETVEAFKTRVLDYFLMTEEVFTDYLGSKLFVEDKEKCWQSYFALVFVMGYNTTLLNQLTDIIICINLLEKIFSAPLNGSFSIKSLNDLIFATICLPDGLFIEDETKGSNDKLWPYAIGDLQLVKQKFERYELGEISEIVNLMRGEEKEIRDRSFRKNEESTEENKYHFNSHFNSDAQSQLDFREQIAETINNNSRTANFNELKTTYGPPNGLTYSGAVTYTDPDNEVTDKSTYAKEIMKRAIYSINTRIHSLRKKVLTSENEKTIISKIDNRMNENDYSGVYRWLNKIYKNYVVNYGTRLMYELLLSHPSKVFINSEMLFKGEDFQLPPQLSTLGITSYTDITAENFCTLSLNYNNLTPPPKVKIMVSESLTGAESKIVQLPEGYTADYVIVAVIASGEVEFQTIQVAIGTKIIAIEENTGSGELDHASGQMPISTVIKLPLEKPLPTTVTIDYLINVEIQCVLMSVCYLEWQLKVYKEMITDYRMRVKAYYNEIAQRFGDNNASNNIQIVKQSMIQCCKQELYNHYLKNINSTQSGSSIAEMRVLQFIDFVFEWREIYFVFVDNLTLDSKDDQVPIIDQLKNYGEVFNQFMVADYGHVILPVRPGFEKMALLFTETGLLWDGVHNDCCCSSPEPNNNSPVEIVNELKKTYGQKEVTMVSEIWEVKIPTEMQVLNESLFIHKEI